MKAKTDGKFPSVFVLSGQDPDSDQERHHKKKQPLAQSPVMTCRRALDDQRQEPACRPSGSSEPIGKAPPDPGRSPDNDSLFHTDKDKGDRRDRS